MTRLTIHPIAYQPYDRIGKENRIYGLAAWYERRGVRPGDKVTIAVERPGEYRIALDRFVFEKKEQSARSQMLAASNDLEAKRGLEVLAAVARSKPRNVARVELLRLAKASQPISRPTAVVQNVRRAAVPPAIRLLLRELHNGKCQLCSFTFKTRSGEQYFEVHHVDPIVGHHPCNLLVVCPNCHAQLEHAMLREFRWLGAWLVGIRINGRRMKIRQPLAPRTGRVKLLTGFFLVVNSFQHRLVG